MRKQLFAGMGRQPFIRAFAALKAKEKKMSTQEKITELTGAMAHLLQVKNARYGDSAITPLQVFTAAEPANPICIRLDDKLSRVKNAGKLRINDIADIIGYLFLLLIQKDYTADDINSLID